MKVATRAHRILPGLRVRFSCAAADIRAAQGLRHLCFIQQPGLPPRPGGLDRDAFDDLCLHLLVEDHAGQLLACCRILPLPGGAALGGSYAAQHYDLTPLADHAAPMAEIGRFCLHPGAPAGDALRLAWAAITQLVDARGIGLLFGCSSFPGADPARHAPALAHLARHHLGPAFLRPLRQRHEDSLTYAATPPAAAAAALPAATGLPPLLRFYLALGGWVGDVAVLDHELDTLHVFTALPVAAVPLARARRLRNLAQSISIAI